MRVSPEGRKFIQSFEQCRLVAYPDGKGRYAIGWGHNDPEVQPGMKISRTKAGMLFIEDLKEKEEAVVRLVKLPLLQHEFDALVSLVYNIGQGAFKDSGLLKRLNNAERVAAADHFLRWNKQDDQVLAELVGRRAAEKKLFMGYDYATAMKEGEAAYGDYVKQRLQTT